MSLGHVIYWTGAAVLVIGGWAIVAAVSYVAIEFTIKALGVSRLVLGWYADKLRARGARRP